MAQAQTIERMNSPEAEKRQEPTGPAMIDERVLAGDRPAFDHRLSERREVAG